MFCSLSQVCNDGNVDYDYDYDDDDGDVDDETSLV